MKNPFPQKKILATSSGVQNVPNPTQKSQCERNGRMQ